MKNFRENMLISSIILIVLGSMISLGANMILGIAMGVSGIVCFVLGLSANTNFELSPEKIANWTPSEEKLPDAGRFMYRVDVTLDEPFRSTILCGPCGHVEIVEGKRPSSYTCEKCNKELWDSEEE